MRQAERAKIRELLHHAEDTIVRAGLVLWEGLIQTDSWDMFYNDVEDVLRCSLILGWEADVLNLNDCMIELSQNFQQAGVIASWLLERLRQDFHMDLKSLTQIWFNFFEMLTEVDIAQIVSQAKYLEELCFEYCGLKNMPRSICALKNLKILNLLGNGLTFLPSEIGQLSNLRSLCLGDNDLVDLPEELRQLNKLEDLDLSYNPDLGYWLPECIYNLKGLKCLGIYRYLRFDPCRLSANLELWLHDLDFDHMVDVPVYQIIARRSLKRGDNQYSRYYDICCRYFDFETRVFDFYGALRAATKKDIKDKFASMWGEKERAQKKRRYDKPCFQRSKKEALRPQELYCKDDLSKCQLRQQFSKSSYYTLGRVDK